LPIKKGLIALDDFDDNLCVFRSLTVHRGSDKQHNLRKTRKLAREYFTWYDIPNEIVEFQHIPSISKHFNQEIIVYDVTPEGVFALKDWFKDSMGEVRELLREDEEWVLEEDEEEGKNPPMTTGIFQEHAFLITDLEKATNTYACAHCDAIFTKSCHLLRHAESCTKGQTKINCPGERIFAPQSLFERAFYIRKVRKFDFKACCWIEYESRQRGIHIHHHACGHGSERMIANHLVDGYHHETKTVFQYHGCHFHGCSTCYPSPEEREVVICEQKEKGLMVKIT